MLGNNLSIIKIELKLEKKGRKEGYKFSSTLCVLKCKLFSFFFIYIEKNLQEREIVRE